MTPASAGDKLSCDMDQASGLTLTAYVPSLIPGLESMTRHQSSSRDSADRLQVQGLTTRLDEAGAASQASTSARYDIRGPTE